jgi:hypothetical protein
MDRGWICNQALGSSGHFFLKKKKQFSAFRKNNITLKFKLPPRSLTEALRRHDSQRIEEFDQFAFDNAVRKRQRREIEERDEQHQLDVKSKQVAPHRVPGL